MSFYKRKQKEHIQRLEAKAKKRILIGLFLIVFGFIVSEVTYSSAALYGGVFVIAFGPILFGIYSVIKGLWELASS